MQCLRAGTGTISVPRLFFCSRTDWYDKNSVEIVKLRNVYFWLNRKKKEVRRARLTQSEGQNWGLYATGVRSITARQHSDRGEERGAALMKHEGTVCGLKKKPPFVAKQHSATRHGPLPGFFTYYLHAHLVGRPHQRLETRGRTRKGIW